MNEATRRRLGALEGVVRQPDEPTELKVLVTEQVFASRAQLVEHTRKVEADRHLQVLGRESIDTIRVTVVSIGDEPCVRDDGEAVRTPAKRTSGTPERPS